MPRDFVARFVEQLRAQAADGLLGESAEARLVAKIADKLEREYEAYMDERLSPAQAAAESGYTRQGIHFLRSRRVITDRRRDLPRKAGFGVEMPKDDQTPVAGGDLVDDVIAARRRGAMKRSA